MKSIFHQIGFFGFVGLLATFLHAAVFTALSWINWEPLAANVIAFICAVPVSFFGNRVLTFKAQGNLFRFILMSLGGLFMNHLNVWIITSEIGLDWKFVLPGMLLIVPAFSFFISKFWVYRTFES
ncbi:GtrA family protein [Ochrobactrum sp. BTU1]|uniref:GtrA family protein n=1 Tax=Ochrobactrum sp. BTU1 TaxID=2840456 RepID=UPI001C044BDB|nr:GtrA family protein [Ochrobactrum sp. BTU1]